MAEGITLLLFLLQICLCIMTGRDILYALAGSLLCFSTYCFYRGHSVKQLFRMWMIGIKRIKGILIILMLIGMLTATWRSSGAISFMVYHGIHIISPKYFILSVFLCCSFVSFLLGSCFGSSGTVGVLCMTMGYTMGMNPVVTAGAIISGAFFGDRSSPMSSSALLVAELTQTDIYETVIKMLKTAFIPFIVSCLLYCLHTTEQVSNAEILQKIESFQQFFTLSPIVCIPVVLMILLSAFRTPIQIIMSCSVLCASVISVMIQKMTLSSLLQCLIFGFRPDSQDATILLLSGGGIASMIRVIFIIIISACYLGIFQQTPLLSRINHIVTVFANKTTSFFALMITSIFMNMIGCNQSLGTMLTLHFFEPLIPDKKVLALYLENSCIIIAGWIPWNIMLSVPLATIGAEVNSLRYAYFVFLLPFYFLLVDTISVKKKQSSNIM